MLLRPEGLIPEERRELEFETGVHDTPLVDVIGVTGELLRTEALRKEFGGLVAVDDVDFSIPRDSIISLIGPNGAGKTTFFNMLTGVYKPTAGRVIFDGEDIGGKPPHAITQRGIGRTFQNIRLFQQMTALENVLVGMHSRLHSARDRRRSSERRACGARRPRRAIARWSCWRTAGWPVIPSSSRGISPTATSAGSSWRARSRPQPKLLLLDEPTAGMNPQETASLHRPDPASSARTRG